MNSYHKFINSLDAAHTKYHEVLDDGLQSIIIITPSETHVWRFKNGKYAGGQ